MDLTFRHFEKPPQRTLNFYSNVLGSLSVGCNLTSASDLGAAYNEFEV